MPLTAKKIELLMMFHLEHLNSSGQLVTQGTTLSAALSKQAVAGMSARALFKLMVRRDILNNGGADKPWPEKWFDLSVKTLAPQLLT